MHTGNTDFSVSSGDHGPVIQSAINALRSLGGVVSLKGSAAVTTQLFLYPGIGLRGQGPMADFAHPLTDPNGTIIFSNYNGSALVCQVDPNNTNVVSFPFISNLVMCNTSPGVEYIPKPHRGE